MGKASLLVLAVLPLTFSNVAKIPFGNNKHYGGYNPVPHPHEAQTYTQTVTYHGCGKDLTADWHVWEGGSSGGIRIKRKPNTQNSDSWDLGLNFDRPLDSLDVFNGVIDSEEQSRSYKIKPEKWNSRLAPGEETVVNIKATFSPNSLPPVLESVVINGKYHACNTTQAVPLKPAHVTTKGFRSSPHPAWPSKIMGLYILLADDDEDGFESEADWNPELFEWQQEASNVLFFTFIHPDTMDIPPSFQKLAATRGTGTPGSVPSNTVILFAIGGYAYSLKPNPWKWLTSKAAAEEMAEKVATWPDLYGCDGIDLDIEEGAGARQEAGINLVHFIRRLKQLQPNMIISQPTYGYPQVKAEIDVINASWDENGESQNLADSVGLMVYEGTNSLNYIKNYAEGTSRWEGFPIKVDMPRNAILLGAKGQASSSDINRLADEAISQDLLGIMVWYASVKNGFDYSPVWDASTRADSIEGYKSAMTKFNVAMGGATKTEEDDGSSVGVVDDQSEAVIDVNDIEDANEKGYLEFRH